jgi:hypothetical protein
VETKILMVMASLVLLYVPGLYLYKTAKGLVTPNPVTFGVRSFAAILNVVTYFLSTGRDPFKSTVTAASAIGLTAIFVYSRHKGLASKVNWYDKVVGGVSVVALIVGMSTKESIAGNFVLQFALLIPFIPHIRGVLSGNAKEHVLPWILATLSYVLMTAALWLSPTTTKWQFVHPVCVGILGNGALAFAVAWKNNRKDLSGDIFFGLQFGAAWVFTVPQFVRSFTSTAGMTTTWSLLCAIFCLVNLTIAVTGYRQAKTKTRKGWQLITVYANWVVLWSAMLVSMLINGHWTTNDTLVTSLVVISVSVMLGFKMLISRFAGEKVSLRSAFMEPITRGIISLIVKSTPQLFIAFCIYRAGSNSGLIWSALLIGHITVCLRIAEIWLGVRQDRHLTKPNKGLLISEIGNEITWLVTTAFWLYFR